MLVFGLSSLASGFAQNSAWIIIARVVQGLGAAIIFHASMSILTLTFPLSQRGLALSIYGAIGTIEKQGQAGGINLTLQIFGGSIGLAVLGVVLKELNSFKDVLLTCAIVVFIVLVIGWVFI